MEKLKELFDKYKDKEDCTYYEFVNLYDTMLEVYNQLGMDTLELRNMYNHEYAIVKNWTTSNGNDGLYDRERKKGFQRMKTMLEFNLRESK